MMMRCSEVLKYLYAYLDSELDTRLMVDMAEHLLACEPCRKIFDYERQLENFLQKSYRESAKMPSAVWERLQRRHPSSWGIFSKGLAACVMGLGMTLLLLKVVFLPSLPDRKASWKYILPQEYQAFLYQTKINFQSYEAPHPNPPPKRGRETTKNLLVFDNIPSLSTYLRKTLSIPVDLSRLEYIPGHTIQVRGLKEISLGQTIVYELQVWCCHQPVSVFLTQNTALSQWLSHEGQTLAPDSSVHTYFHQFQNFSIYALTRHTLEAAQNIASAPL